jgi:hypothetical protein
VVLGKDNWLLIMLRYILEEKFSVELYLLFTDFKQTYDSINKIYLYETLNEFWMP